MNDKNKEYTRPETTRGHGDLEDRSQEVGTNGRKGWVEDYITASPVALGAKTKTQGTGSKRREKAI